MTNEQRSVSDMLLKHIAEATPNELSEAIRQYSLFNGAVESFRRSSSSREFWYEEFRKEIKEKLLGH